jgi:hypothetical protein
MLWMNVTIKFHRSVTLVDRSISFPLEADLKLSVCQRTPVFCFGMSAQTMPPSQEATSYPLGMHTAFGSLTPNP